METFTILLTMVAAWHVLRVRYQKARVTLLGQHLADLQLEKHMQTLTEGYSRAIHESDPDRQIQIFKTFADTENAVARQVQALSASIHNEQEQSTRMGVLPFCIPYVEVAFPFLTRDFRRLLQIHATGLQHIVDNNDQLSVKDRAFHLSAELYLLQHSCHWFCKSRAVADARLVVRHKVNYQKVLESVSDVTRLGYMAWFKNSGRH
ncbi:MAG TPA: hypothetical protein VK062_02545 [Burkholderiaceae bacterium]|nr:hypothetical protein [Burkholderiaceae bacterium]